MAAKTNLQGLCFKMGSDSESGGEKRSKFSAFRAHREVCRTQEGCCGFCLVCGGTARWGCFRDGEQRSCLPVVSLKLAKIQQVFELKCSRHVFEPPWSPLGLWTAATSLGQHLFWDLFWSKLENKIDFVLMLRIWSKYACRLAYLWRNRMLWDASVYWDCHGIVMKTIGNGWSCACRQHDFLLGQI